MRKILNRSLRHPNRFGMMKRMKRRRTQFTMKNVEIEHCVWFSGAYFSTFVYTVYVNVAHRQSFNIYSFYGLKQMNTNMCMSKGWIQIEFLFFCPFKSERLKIERWKDKKQTNGRKITCNCTWPCIISTGKPYWICISIRITKYFMFNDCCLEISIGYLPHVFGNFFAGTGTIWYLWIEIAMAGRRRKETESTDHHKVGGGRRGKLYCVKRD